MNTRGTWQKHIAPIFQDHLIRHELVDYGFQILRVLRPLTKRLVEQVSVQIVDAHRKHAAWGLKSAAVGHSFGTLCIGSALQWNPDLALPRIVTFGSILPCDFPWKALVENGQVTTIRN